MKGFVYGCVERENGFLHDEDFVDRHAYVLTQQLATLTVTFTLMANTSDTRHYHLRRLQTTKAKGLFGAP